MSDSNPSTISRFVHVYKGIEDFYFLNRNGELGYIKSGALRSVKETFPQLRDRRFLHDNPDFLRGLEEFLRELGEISSAYPGNEPPSDLELGYVLPAGDRHRWRTATLVLHKHVLETLKADYELKVRDGTQDLLEAKWDLSQIMQVRSIHQGLDELTYHTDSFGQYRYFPALYLLPEQADKIPSDGTRSRVRVVNLLWCGRGPGATQRSTVGPSDTRELVFRVLRENLTRRGAIDRSQRAEHRASVA